MRTLTRALFTLIFTALIASGCSAGGDPVPVATGLLYVLDRANAAVYIYDNIATLDGAQDPVRTLTGENTQIENPTALTVDPRRDILYVADSTEGEVFAFIPGSEADGDIEPRRTYTGVDRLISLYYDVENDSLYGADLTDFSIRVWDDISTAPNGTAPNRRIGLGYPPSAVFVDTQRDRLYVGDPGTSSVQAYDNASTLGVNNPPADATITDDTQPFVFVSSLTMNVPNDFLYVGERFNPSVEIFNSVSTLNGSVAVPTDRSLEGDATGLTLDMGQTMFVENVLYVQQSRTQIGFWDSANTVTGDTAPNRALTVNPASLIVGFMVDLAH
ncbi:hypothetical protein FBR05_11445 [Deltaproteobacteria bacterium PRO3]|nr:hypothetical protein [Deltaproteobacteria bacterium PRO3]